ncbi:MAG: glycosidase [bacterium]
MANNHVVDEIFRRHSGNPILGIKDWPYPANSVFNCAATLHNGETVLLARVEDRRGISHLTVAKSKDGISNWHIDEKPTFQPDPENYPEEIWGIEDPRITYVEEIKEYVVAYTAYSRGGPLVSLAKTRDFITFERIGAVLPPEDKDAALFPVRFNRAWAMIHRPTGTQPRTGAHIWISFSPDLKHWGEHHIVIRAREGGWWDANKIGLSPQPLRTAEGWLVLYHGVRKTGAGVIYRLGLALLDLENPVKVLRRSDEWIFGPQAHYERQGDVDDVVFPCGWTVQDENVYLYYGSADTCIALATAKVSDLRNYIMSCPEENHSGRWG